MKIEINQTENTGSDVQKSCSVNIENITNSKELGEVIKKLEALHEFFNPVQTEATNCIEIVFESINADSVDEFTSKFSKVSAKATDADRLFIACTVTITREVNSQGNALGGLNSCNNTSYLKLKRREQGLISQLNQVQSKIRDIWHLSAEAGDLERL